MRQEKTLFSVILALLFCVYLPYLFTHRMPPGHDTWQYLIMQYNFLNQQIQNGTISQWTPFMTHGSIANWWFGVQGGILQLCYLTLGKLVSGFNFLTLFHIGMLFDEIALLIGVWLLSKRYFVTIHARFFVTVSIVGSAIWMDQVWLNFHSYYTFPFLLELFHRFFEKKSFIYFFLAANLLAFHIMGGLAYFLPYVALLVFIYFFIQYVIYKKDIYTLPFRSLNRTDFLWIILSVFSFIYLYLFLKNGMGEIYLSNLGRSASGGTTELSSFLEVGGYTSLHKFLEMLIGVSTSLNQTMYAGVFVLPFVIIALANHLTKRCLHLAIFVLLLILISIGSNSFVTSTSYFAWPEMKLMRYLGLTGSFAKIFLCFVAGMGIDFIVLNPDRKPKLLPLILILMGAMVPLFLLQCALPEKNILGLEFYHRMTLGRIYDDPINLINRCLVMAFYYTLGIITLISLQDSGKREKTGLILLLAVHTLDVFGYKSHINYSKSVGLTQPQYQLFQFQKFEYPQQRISDYRGNERYKTLENVMFKSVQFVDGAMVLPNDRYPPTGQYGSLQWCHESFLNIDSVQSPFRTDFWMKPVDELMRIYWKWPDPETNPGLLTRKFLFPFGNIAVEKMAGYALPKVQFFHTAIYENDANRIKSLFENPNYMGDRLVIYGQPTANAQLIQEPNRDLKANDRMNIQYDVKNFGWDFLQIHLKEPAKESIWLYYSDTWHPFWKAFVNKQEAKIWRANIAYKAIQLNSGDQDIEFHFRNNLQSALIFTAQINAWMWAFIFIGLLFSILRTKTETTELQQSETKDDCE